MMCQCRFILSKEYTIVVSDVDNGGGCACVGETRDIREISIPSSHFYYKPITVLKKLSLKKKAHNVIYLHNSSHVSFVIKM